MSSKILQNLKDNKYKYMTIGIVTLISVVCLVFVIHSKRSVNRDKGCPIGMLMCPDNVCYDKCDNDGLIFDCKKKKCVCKYSDRSICGNTCCKKGECQIIDKRPTCCPSDRKCAKECCKAGYVCKEGECMELCGIESDHIFCDATNNKSCFKSLNMDETTKEHFERLFKGQELKTIKKNDKYDGFTCVPKSKCGIGERRYLSQLGKRILCTDMFNIADKDGNLGYCTSNDDSAESAIIKECSEADYKSCINNPKCEFKPAQNTKFEDLETDVRKYGLTIGQEFNDYKGKKCGENTYYVTTYKEADSTKPCGPALCWETMNVENGINSIVYDNDTCTGISPCIDDEPAKYKTKCETSDPCPDKMYCDKDGNVFDTKNIGGYVPDANNRQIKDGKPKCIWKSRINGADSDTETECLNKLCLPGEETEKSLCCADGYEYSNGICYQKQMNMDKSKSNKDNKCGNPAWRSYSTRLNPHYSLNYCCNRTKQSYKTWEFKLPHCNCPVDDTKHSFGDTEWVRAEGFDNNNMQGCVKVPADTNVQFHCKKDVSFEGCKTSWEKK